MQNSLRRTVFELRGRTSNLGPRTRNMVSALLESNTDKDHLVDGADTLVLRVNLCENSSNSGLQYS